MDFKKNLLEISAHPTAIITLVGILILLLGITRMKKVKLTPKIIAQIGVAIGLASILKLFKLYEMPFGGSVTLGSMVPIILIALLYGAEAGFLAGFIFGLIDFIIGPAYILHPIQVLFDYSLPFMALGVAGYFKDRRVLGTFLAVLSRFVFHYISGVVFWGSYAKNGMSPYFYSLVYNGSYLGVDCIICMIIIAALPISQLYAILSPHNNMQ